MFSALLACVSVILAALVQNLKLPQKRIRIVICFLVVSFFVFLILAFVTEKPFGFRERTEQTVTGSIIIINNYFTDLSKEEKKENANEIFELYGITIPKMTEEIFNRTKDGLYDPE